MNAAQLLVRCLEAEGVEYVFGLPGFRVERAADSLPTLQRALALPEPSVIEVPVDYSENLRLTEKLGQLTCVI